MRVIHEPLSSIRRRAIRTFDPATVQILPAPAIVIALVGVQLLGPAPRPARFAAAGAYRRVLVEQRLGQRAVVGVGRREQSM